MQISNTRNSQRKPIRRSATQNKRTSIDCSELPIHCYDAARDWLRVYCEMHRSRLTHEVDGIRHSFRSCSIRDSTTTCYLSPTFATTAPYRLATVLSLSLQFVLWYVISVLTQTESSVIAEATPDDVSFQHVLQYIAVFRIFCLIEEFLYW